MASKLETYISPCGNFYKRAKGRKMASSFLNLPSEIRMLVYEKLFIDTKYNLIPRSPIATSDDQVRPSVYHTKKASLQLAILLACRKVHSECKTLAYRSTVFYLSCIPELDYSEGTMPSNDSVDIVPLRNRLSEMSTINRNLIQYLAVPAAASESFSETLQWWDDNNDEPAFPNVGHVTVVAQLVWPLLTFKTNVALLVLRSLPRVKIVMIICKSDELAGRDRTLTEVGVPDGQSRNLRKTREFFNLRLQMTIVPNPSRVDWRKGFVDDLTSTKNIAPRCTFVHYRRMSEYCPTACIGVRRSTKDILPGEEIKGGAVDHVKVFFGGPAEAIDFIYRPLLDQCPAEV